MAGGARRRQGQGLGEEPKTPQTLAASPREALERAVAKHKQTHARPDSGSDRGWVAPARAAARFKGAARAPPPSSAPLPLLPRPAT